MGRAKKGVTAATFAFLMLGVILVGGEVGPGPPECSDGIDNDGDGYTDSTPGNADAECTFVIYNSPPDPPTIIECQNWYSESVAPASLTECNQGHP